MKMKKTEWFGFYVVFICPNLWLNKVYYWKATRFVKTFKSMNTNEMQESRCKPFKRSFRPELILHFHPPNLCVWGISLQTTCAQLSLANIVITNLGTGNRVFSQPSIIERCCIHLGFDLAIWIQDKISRSFSDSRSFQRNLNQFHKANRGSGHQPPPSSQSSAFSASGFKAFSAANFLALALSFFFLFFSAFFPSPAAGSTQLASPSFNSSFVAYIFIYIDYK